MQKQRQKYKPSRGRSKARRLSSIKKELEAEQKAKVIKLYGRDCYTCPAKALEGRNCQLGHVPWPRSDLGPKAKYDHRYTRIQCNVCNVYKNGMGAVALQRMIDEGIDVKALREESDAQKGKMVPNQWYLDKIEEYRVSN